MRKIYVFILMSLLAFSANAEKLLPKVYFTSGPTATWEKEKLNLTFTATIYGPKRGDLQIKLIPYYYIGKDTVEYAPLIFSTNSGAKFAKRRNKLEGLPDMTDRTVIMHHGWATASFSEYEMLPWSPKGRLYIKQVLSSCCEEFIMDEVRVKVPSREVKADTVTVVEYVDVIKEKEYETVTTEKEAQLDLFIKYPVGKSDVLPNFNGNATELRKLDDLLYPLLKDPKKYQVERIVITGHTSPEGTANYNQRLSVKRAESMRLYMLSNYYRLRDVRLEAEGLGEDWEGLRNLVEGNGLYWERQALSVIDSRSELDWREKTLKGIHGGQPYKFMLKNYYPQLRRISLKIVYKITETEIREKQ